MPTAKAKTKSKKKAKSKSRSSHYTTDHHTIKQWTEERGGRPTTVSGTERKEDEPGILRIDFPGYTGEGKLRRVSWYDFFKKFDQENLVFVFQEYTKDGEQSNFNKFVRMQKEKRMAQAGTGSKGASARGGERKSRASATGRQESTGRTKPSASSAKGGRNAGGRAAAGGATGGKRSETSRASVKTGRGQGKTTRGGASAGASTSGSRAGSSRAGRSATATKRPAGQAESTRTRGPQGSAEPSGTKGRSERKTKRAGSQKISSTGTRGQRTPTRERKVAGRGSGERPSRSAGRSTSRSAATSR